MLFRLLAAAFIFGILPLFILVMALFPVYALLALYRVVEFMSLPFGDETQETLTLRYENLRQDPKAYQQAHPVYILYVRVLGILMLIVHAWIMASLFIGG